MPSRIPRRLPQTCIPLLIGILLLSAAGGVRFAEAQEDEDTNPDVNRPTLQRGSPSPDSQSPPSRDRFAVPVDVLPQQEETPPQPSRQNIGQPVDMSVYENPDVTGDGQPDDPNLRKGNCCVLSEFEKAGGCLWGIGVNLQGQAALDACKAVDPNRDGKGDGIHYVQGDLSQYLDGSPVPDLSWKACSIQCGVLKRVTYCYPETYTCSTKPPEADLWGEIPWYNTPGDCAEACVPPAQPVDLQTSVGCACGEGGIVRCGIDVAQNPETVSDSAPASPARIDRVTVQVEGEGALEAGDAFIVGAEGARTDDVINAGYPEEDGGFTLAFTSANFTIPGAGESSRKGRGGGFHAEVTMLAADGVEHLLRVETVQSTPDRTTTSVQSAPDPNPENDVAYSNIPMLQRCGAFLLNAQCGLEKGQAPGLWHTYTLELPESGGEETRVTFDLNPEGDGGCLDPETVDVPEYLANVCTNEPEGESLTCVVPPGGSRTVPRLEQLTFTVEALATKNCPAGIAIPVTAEVVTGKEPPLRFEVTERKIPCGQCDVCGAYPTRDACDAAPKDGNDVSYCSWKYVAKSDDFRCVSNDRNPSCPIWYGCCMWTTDLPEDMKAGAVAGAEPRRTYIYAGRVEGQYRPAAAEQSPFGVGNAELFKLAEQCYQQGLRTGYVTRWHRQPSETITDPAVPQSVQESVEQCEEREFKKRRGEESSTGPPSQTRQRRPEGEHDWYCSFAYEDIVADTQTASLINLVARKDCEVFEPDVNPRQTGIKGTAYAAVAYNQKDTAESDRFSCPATCELVTKKWGTCYVSAEGGCQTHYDLDRCIGEGDTFFTDGVDGQRTCNRTCKGGLCGPAPAGWNRPAEAL